MEINGIQFTAPGRAVTPAEEGRKRRDEHQRGAQDTERAEEQHRSRQELLQAQRQRTRRQDSAESFSAPARLYTRARPQETAPDRQRQTEAMKDKISRTYSQADYRSDAKSETRRERQATAQTPAAQHQESPRHEEVKAYRKNAGDNSGEAIDLLA